MSRSSVLDGLSAPPGWSWRSLWSTFSRIQDSGNPNLTPLSVYLEHGVVPRDSRDDNHNQLGEDLSRYLVVRPGDLVFNKLRTWQGGLGRSAYEGIVSPAYFVCRPTDVVDSRFVHYQLISAIYLAELRRISKWMPPSQFDTPWDMLKRLPLLLPALEEQRSIADFLDAETARIDRFRELTKDQRSLLAERRRIAFHEAVADEGGPDFSDLDLRGSPSASEWQVFPLNRLLTELTNGYVGPTRDLLVDSGVPYLQSLHIKGGYIDFERKPYFVPREWADSRPRIRLSAGDVLIVQTGGIGEVAIVDEYRAGSSCHALLIARTNSMLMPEFLWHTLTSYWGNNTLLREQTGAMHPHLEAGNIWYVKIAVPSVDTQNRIVKRTEKIVQNSRALDGKLASRLELLAERRQALITAAVTGELDVSTASGRGIEG